MNKFSIFVFAIPAIVCYGFVDACADFSTDDCTSGLNRMSAVRVPDHVYSLNSIRTASDDGEPQVLQFGALRYPKFDSNLMEVRFAKTASDRKNDLLISMAEYWGVQGNAPRLGYWDRVNYAIDALARYSSLNCLGSSDVSRSDALTLPAMALEIFPPKIEQIIFSARNGVRSFFYVVTVAGPGKFRAYITIRLDDEVVSVVASGADISHVQYFAHSVLRLNSQIANDPTEVN